MSNLMTGANILVECLLREGVDCLFGYPGGVTLPFYDVLYDAKVKHYLVRHEENAGFAAQGYARSTGKVGVCCATSGPGATNLVTGLVDALLDSIPIVAITGQVSTKLIGSDAFQEADTFGITRACTKHNFLVKSAAELPQAIHEAFYIAASGRPGPVLVDIPKDVFIGNAHYEPVGTIHLPGYKFSTEGHAGQIRRAAEMMWDAQRPIVYAGGGVISAGASGSLRELVETIDAPAVCTLMGLGGLPSGHPNFISMPGMHGSYAANMAMTHTDLIIALGARFDDRVTGRLDAFAPHARVIHVDIDPVEIGKNRAADLPIVGNLGPVLEKMNAVLAELAPSHKPRRAADRQAWKGKIASWAAEHPLSPPCPTPRSSRSTWCARSTGSPAGTRSSVPTWGSTRCGERSSCGSTGPGCGSAPGASARWGSGCLPPSARRSPTRAGSSSPWWGTAASRCRSPSWPRWRITACRSRSS